MASEDPKCPDCEGPIGADWDWCLHCGYDPDHLKPWDWRPQSGQSSGQMSGSVQTAAAPGKVGLIDLTERKRRSKRADRPKRKSRSAKAEHAEPKVATMATTSSLIVLPSRPSDPTPTRSAPVPAAPGRVAATPPTAPMAPAPPAPVASSAPVVDRPHTARPDATAPLRQAPAPAPRPTVADPAPAPKFDMTSPLQSSAPKFDMTSPIRSTASSAPTRQQLTRVISLPRTTLSMVPSIVLFALGALMLYVALSSMSRLSHGDILSRATTVLFILVCIALACGMAAQGYSFMKVRVEVGPEELIAHNRFGRPSTARIRDIFSVKMGTRRYLDVPLLSRPVEVPYVQMQDGSGFWLDALEGQAGESPSPDQQVVIDVLVRTVAANRSEALQDESAGGLV